MNKRKNYYQFIMIVLSLNLFSFKSDIRKSSSNFDNPLIYRLQLWSDTYFVVVRIEFLSYRSCKAIPRDSYFPFKFLYYWSTLGKTFRFSYFPIRIPLFLLTYFTFITFYTKNFPFILFDALIVWITLLQQRSISW